MENNFKFYNTLTRQIDTVVPRVDGKIGMYTCGPTVYHFAHIGNIRSYIMEDVLEKALRYVGYDVKRVMNITDVGHLSSDGDTGEDKMLKGAKREHKSVMEVAKEYTDAFFKDFTAVHNRMPDVVEPATNCIPEFIHMVEVLIEKGYAYFAGGNVYFDTSKLDDYFVFSSAVEKEQLQVGVRDDVEEDVNKKNKNDFVLWFPHHTNEIAQSESYLGHDWCKYWFHVNHLNDRAGKMSKSKGAILTVSVLQEKGYNPLAYRFFCLQSHYRKPLEFSFDALDNAVAAYNKIAKRVAELKDEGDIDETAFADFKKKFTDAVSNDLNTSMAITIVYDVLKADISDRTKLALIDDFEQVLDLGLRESGKALFEASSSVDSELEAFINDKIAERAAAKKAKDFATADAIRDELLAKGVAIKDTREGVKWELV